MSDIFVYLVDTQIESRRTQSGRQQHLFSTSTDGLCSKTLQTFQRQSFSVMMYSMLTDVTGPTDKKKSIQALPYDIYIPTRPIQGTISVPGGKQTGKKITNKSNGKVIWCKQENITFRHSRNKAPIFPIDPKHGRSTISKSESGMIVPHLLGGPHLS